MAYVVQRDVEMACAIMLGVSPGARRMAGAALAELQVDNYTAHRGAAVPKPGGIGVFCRGGEPATAGSRLGRGADDRRGCRS